MDVTTTHPEMPTALYISVHVPLRLLVTIGDRVTHNSRQVSLQGLPWFIY